MMVVVAAEPDLVRVDWERRLSVAVGKSFALSANPRVAIDGMPTVGDKGHFVWSRIAVQVVQRSDAAVVLHPGDLQAVVQEQLNMVLAEDAQVDVDYIRFEESPVAPTGVAYPLA